MKSIFVPVAAGLFAASITLSGCSTLNGLTAQGITTIITDAQAVAKATCAVIPTALSIVNLFNTGAYVTAEAIAAAVCAAVGGPPAATSFHRVRGFAGAVWSPHPVVINGQVVNFL